MNSGLDKTIHKKLWVIFSFFILIVVALLAIQVNNFIDAKNQRENVEELRKAQTKFINSTLVDKAKLDSADAASNTEKD